MLAFEVAVFLAMLFLVDGLAALLGKRRDGRVVNRRLKLLSAGDSGEEVLRKLATRKGEGWLHPKLMVLPPYRRLDRLRALAGMSTPTPQLRGGAVVLGLVVFALTATLAGLPPRRAAMVAEAAAVVLPLWLLNRRAANRARLFQSQLVDAVDIMVRSLRAGHPVASALGLAAREMPDPVGTELGLTCDEMTYGLDLRDALENLARRVPYPELHYLVVAIRVQYGTGGNLAEVLNALSKVLRERNGLVAKIAAWSAEGRLSAWVLSALPVVVGFAVNTMNPTYYSEVADDPLFAPIMGAGAMGVVLGIVILRKMVNFRI